MRILNPSSRLCTIEHSQTDICRLLCLTLPLLDLSEIGTYDNGSEVKSNESNENTNVSVSVLNIVSKWFVLADYVSFSRPKHLGGDLRSPAQIRIGSIRSCL